MGAVGPAIAVVCPPPAVRWTVGRRFEADLFAALDLYDAAVVNDDLHGAEAQASQGPEHRRAEIGLLLNNVYVITRH